MGGKEKPFFVEPFSARARARNEHTHASAVLAPVARAELMVMVLEGECQNPGHKKGMVVVRGPVCGQRGQVGRWAASETRGRQRGGTTGATGGGEAKERGNERGKRKGLHNKARHPVRALECVFGCLSVVKVLPFQTRWRRAHVVCANAEVAPTDAPAALSALTVNV